MSSNPQPLPIKLAKRQESTLEQITRRQTAAQNLVRRAKIILAVAKGMNNHQTARHLAMDRETVRTWRERWLKASATLLDAEAEEVGAQEWLGLIETVLSDAPRPGTPATFSPEQDEYNIQTEPSAWGQARRGLGPGFIAGFVIGPLLMFILLMISCFMSTKFFLNFKVRGLDFGVNYIKRTKVSNLPNIR